MTALVFLDTETTGLGHDAEIWEVAAIRREGDRDVAEHHHFVEHDLDKAAKLPEWFRADHGARYDPAAAIDRHTLATVLTNLMDGRPHVIGAVPNFDTERLAQILRNYDLLPGWHYHLIDIETYIAGYLRGKYGITAKLPWDSNLLSLAVGVPPSPERHTAMGDVRWIKATWDAIHGISS
jgi:hypothetical protein